MSGPLEVFETFFLFFLGEARSEKRSTKNAHSFDLFSLFCFLPNAPISSKHSNNRSRRILASVASAYGAMILGEGVRRLFREF